MAQDELNRISFIDGLRGCAALAVLFVHSTFVAAPPAYIIPFVNAGALGVQLFFMVSAFTLFYSFDARRKKEPFRLGAFFLRRFFRIAPLFYCVFLLCIFTRKNAPQYWAPDGVTQPELLTYVLFLNGWWPHLINSVVPGGWSIAIETSFYALVPVLFYSLRSWWHALLFVFSAYLIGRIASSNIAEFWRLTYPSNQQYLVETWKTLSLPNQLYVFGFGILAYFTWRDKLLLFPKLGRKPYLMAFCMSIVLLVICSYTMPGRLSVSATLIFLLLITGAMAQPRLLVTTPIRFVGKISYSLYLFHFFIYESLPKFPSGVLPWLAAIATELALAIPCAYVGYVLIEEPFQNLGRRLISQLRPSARQEEH